MTAHTASRNPRPAAVVDVRHLRCPDHPAGGTHEIVVSVHRFLPVSVCRWCEETWADLDASVRPTTEKS